MSDNPFALENIGATPAQPSSQSNAASPSDNPFSLRAIEADRQQDLRVNLQRAVRQNPDQAAEADKLSKQFNVAPDVLARNLMDAKVQDAVLKADSRLQTSPKLAEAMRSKPWLAPQSHDDIEPLAALEQFVSDTYGSVKAGGLNASKGAAGVFRAGLELVAPVLDFLEPVTEIGGNPLRRLAEGFAIQAQNAGDRAKAVAPKTNGVLDGGFQSGIQSLTQNTLALPLAFLPGGQPAALSMMTATTGGQSYQDAREKGLAMQQALPFAASQAAIEYATEKIPLGKLLGDVKAGTPFLQTLAKQIGLEIPGEQVATVLQDLNEWAVLNPEKPFSDYIAERPNAMAQTLVATIVGAGGNVTVAKGIESVANAANKRALSQQEAQAHAAQLQQAMAAAAQSKLRERNPETFRELAADMSEDATVFVDAQVLAQSAPELAQALPAVAEQLNDALTANSTVEVPVADILTLAPGTPLEQVFLQNARRDPNAQSLADVEAAAKQGEEFIKQEAERVMQQAADQQAWQASSTAVQQTIKQQLDATGRFTSDVNEAYATLQANFFSSMASRLGLTPEEMYQRYSLKVAGQGQGVGYSASRPGALTVEGFHYSKAARPVVSTAMFGTGLQGSNREQYLNAADQRLRKRAYFYVDKGTGITPEDGVGGIAQKAQLTNIYDGDVDPLRLKKGGQLAFESAVLDAGFSGYLTRMDGSQSGQVIMLGDQAIQTEAIGPATQLRGQVVPAPQQRQSLGRDVIVDALQADKALPAGSPTVARWQQLLAGKPEVLQALTDAGVFAGDQNENLYKSDLIARFEAATEAPVYAQSLSSRLPGGKKATEDPLNDTLVIGWDVAQRDTATLEKNVEAMYAYPNFRRPTGRGSRSVNARAEAIINHMVNNLLWLHDHMPAEMRDRARLWYDGGRKTVEAWAKRYGISEMQGAAAIAVLSPQNGWFPNVSQAERIADMVFGLRDFAWDDAMTVEAERISKDDGLDDKMKAAQGKTLGELLATPDIAARWIRVYDQTYNNRAYRVLTPEGGAADYVKTNAGNDATMMWKSYKTIAKAVSVFMDGRAENVHYQIGKEHKVRNFYNNIFDPNSEYGYATIDTHAVAAALLRPLASSDIEVDQAFGGAGSSSTLATGLNGTYPIHWEAYRRAAEARGLQPRQMQSITWEAVRGLFEAAQKKTMKADANAIWERYKAGEIEQTQAQQEILALAGDITPPSWTDAPFNDVPSRTYEGPAQAAIDARGDAGAVNPPSAQVMFEVAPDPNDAALTAEWNALTPAERLDLSQRIAARVVPQVLRELGVSGNYQLQLGGYLGATNPSLALQLDRPELALTAAKMLGFALSQDSMMVVADSPFVGSSPVGIVTLALPEGYGETEVTDLYNRLWELEENGEKLVGGHTTSDGQMVILNYSGLDDMALAARIDAHLGGEFQIDVGTAYSAFPTKEDYGYASDGQEGAATARQSPAQRRPSDLRSQATEALRAELDARRAGPAGTYAQTAGLTTGEQLLAPNGKPSNLTPKLYATVRTPEFKAWFGDWEKDPANASKAVDENGEPKVYYHGSEKAGFTEFETDGKGKTRGTGAFFADNFSMAKGYSGSSDDAPVYTPEQIFANPEVIDGLEIEEGVIVEVVVSSRGDKAWQWYADEEEALADLELEPGEELGAQPGYRAYRPGFGEETGTKEQILDYLDGMTAEAPGVYEVFLNVRDMVTIDWQGNNWDDGPKEKVWNILDETGDVYDTFYSQEEADAALERNPGFTVEEDEQTSFESTDDAARQGRDMNADGVLIKDVFDTGPKGYAEDGDVLIVYKPENIKEVRNQGTFDPANPNILKQGPRGTFNPQDLLVTLNENADLSTFLHESGHFFLEVMADLASQPNAPQQIRDDMATTLKWFGVPDLATWNSYTLDQKRPYHERWAESFEQYLFEGKAPSAELQPLFRRFRSWLVNTYKSLTQFMRGRDLKVSDEIRQVMGRLIATDEQIAQAEAAAGMLPDFDATNEGIEKLQSRSLRDLQWTIKARDKYIKNLTKQANELRKGIEAEVRAEVERQPLYAAMKWLRKGEMVNEAGEQIKAEKGFRLNTEALAEMYPESMLARPDLAGLKGMTAKNGLHPDLVADMFGFESGDALVRNILSAEPIASVIEGMTDQRMLERHGDLATPEAVADAANEAVHNEARARSLATELKAQSEMLNPRQDTGRTASNGRVITVNAITEAAKQFAADIAARRRIKDLRNAAWQHRSAEARAGKAWQEATAKGKTQEAVQAKRDQVLNNATVKALQEAQAEVRKTLEFFKKIVKGNNEKIVKGGRDPDVVNAMRAILAAHDVAPRLEKSALEYMDVVSRNDPAMYAALKPGVDSALFNAKPLTEMTMEELRGLTDQLRAMWELAKRSRQMEVDGNLLDIQDAADELMARMDEIGIPDQVPGEKGAITNREELGLKLQFAKSILSRVEQWAERLDGKFGGPFLRLVFQPVKDAADRYRSDKVTYRKRFTELLKGIAPQLPPGPIAAPELGYTFGNARDSGTAELLHAILHTGNDSNKRKLLLGRQWASENADGTLDTSRWDAFIQRMIDEGKITKAHYDFAQGVWDLLEQMKPLAQETHRRVFGRYFAEVTANEVVTPFGTYRGGYVPAQTDARLVKDAKLRELAEGENESMAYAFPAAPSGFTNARVEYNKPLLLDIRALAQHMDKVLLFSHMQGAVTDVRRLLTDKRVSYALDRIDPGAFEGMLIPWLNRAAKQIVETPTAGDRKLSRFLSASRSRAGMALMFANLSNTVQQVAGFSLAAVKVKPGLMLKATAQFTASPKAMKEAVADASPYMANRMQDEIAAMNSAVEDILVNPNLLEKSQAWTQRHAYFLQSAVDNTMGPIIWTAAYNQAVAEGQDAKTAVRFADGVIRQTQGSTLPEDISRFESGPAAARVFTQFIGYFNMMANTNATAVKQIVDEMGVRKGAGKLIYVALAGLLVNIWVAEAIAQAFRGGPEDEDDDGYLDDWLMAVFGMGTLKGLAATVPFVGQAAQLVVNQFNGNPADDKFSLSPAVSLIESSARAPASVYKAIVDDGNAQKAVRDVAAAATLITGLPIYAAARPLGYVAGIADEKIEPTGPVDFVRGLVTGTASAESKQR